MYCFCIAKLLQGIGYGITVAHLDQRMRFFGIKFGKAKLDVLREDKVQKVLLRVSVVCRKAGLGSGASGSPSHCGSSKSSCAFTTSNMIKYSLPSYSLVPRPIICLNSTMLPMGRGRNNGGDGLFVIMKDIQMLFVQFAIICRYPHAIQGIFHSFLLIDDVTDILFLSCEHVHAVNFLPVGRVSKAQTQAAGIVLGLVHAQSVARAITLPAGRGSSTLQWPGLVPAPHA